MVSVTCRLTTGVTETAGGVGAPGAAATPQDAAPLRDSLHLCEAAIHGQFGSRDVAAVVTGDQRNFFLQACLWSHLEFSALVATNCAGSGLPRSPPRPAAAALAVGIREYIRSSRHICLLVKDAALGVHTARASSNARTTTGLRLPPRGP